MKTLLITEYLNYVEISNTGKTSKIGVGNNSGHKLGIISWYAPWRRYVFSANEANLVFDSKCLKDITAFIDDLMDKRKEKS